MQSSFNRSHRNSLSSRIYAFSGTAILGAIIMMTLPEFFMQPLLPDSSTVPPYALDSGCAAMRIFGAVTLQLAACLHCLADSTEKGNFTKSNTYRCEALSL